MKKRILTGDRTTGKLHIGHYIGSLQNRVTLQSDYDTFILLADVQALTTHFEQPELIRSSILDVAIDNLSVGLDPEKITMFQQSAVPAIAELTVYFSMLVSVNTLRHNPTIKTEAKQYGYSDLTYGFLGYPISQAADITFCVADLVPVGDDQLPHIELSRKVVRRFNALYGDVLKEPEFLLGSCPRLVGLDGGAKMSKSLQNVIHLSDPPETVCERIKSAKTDPERIRASDKGNPEICVVSTYHRFFNPEEAPNICELCRGGSIGCATCKQRLCGVLNETLTPIRERRAYYEQHRSLVTELLDNGAMRACQAGSETLTRVKEAMKLA